jgi:hypothetical protein
VKAANIHASCALIGRHGVLILGESGAGKSDLLLRLMDEGGKLVADDRTELYAVKGQLRARAPQSIAGLIEVRGLGIVAQPFAKSAVLALAVRLGTPKDFPGRLPDFFRAARRAWPHQSHPPDRAGWDGCVGPGARPPGLEGCHKGLDPPGL